MKRILQATTGTAFLTATILNVRKYGFDPATICSLISGTGFFLSTVISLSEEQWKQKLNTTTSVSAEKNLPVDATE